MRLYEQIRDGVISARYPSGERAKEQVFPMLEDEPRHNLPFQLSSFIGRRHECAEVARCLEQHRLVTLTGPGGVGKTRLAIQVAENVLDRFRDGVRYVELASLADPNLVENTLANVMELREEQGIPIIKTITRYLRSKHILLVLDNCEHLIDACARLADDLLQSCQGLTIFTSSREALGVPGEIAFRVPSLSFPDPQVMGAELNLEDYEAIALFVDRARVVLPTFEVTQVNAGAIAQICQRLDGIPLAIELAAARLNLLSTEQIASRLDDVFRLLTGGPRTALPRQQTLRATIDWSFQLLTDTE